MLHPDRAMRRALGRWFMSMYDHRRGPTMPGMAEPCWPWRGPRRDDGGGYIELGGIPLDARRIAWVLSRGPIPEDATIANRCGNAACVRPDHLVAVQAAAPGA